MNSNFTVKAVEFDADGNEDVFGEDIAEAMKLPFNHGWDHWRIYQGDYLIGAFPDFNTASRTCSALNATIVLMAA